MIKLLQLTRSEGGEILTLIPFIIKENQTMKVQSFYFYFLSFFILYTFYFT